MHAPFGVHSKVGVRIRLLWGVIPGSTASNSGESHFCFTCQNWTRFIYIGRQPGLGRSLPARFLKPVQNLYVFGSPPTANNRISAPILQPKSAREHAPSAPQFPRFLHESDASLVMHCFRTVFRPFSLWSGPQYPVMHHFLGKCNTFAAPFAHPAAPIPPTAGADFSPDCTHPKSGVRPSILE